MEFVCLKLYDGHFISGLSFELNLIPIFCGFKKPYLMYCNALLFILHWNEIHNYMSHFN
jgi:hypothetical protein